jgi:hypothetical protein
MLSGSAGSDRFPDDIGINAPFNFNGLVRHYYSKEQSWHSGDLLPPNSARISRTTRPGIRPPKTIADSYGARVGRGNPPARRWQQRLSPVYGPDDARPELPPGKGDNDKDRRSG